MFRSLSALTLAFMMFLLVGCPSGDKGADKPAGDKPAADKPAAEKPAFAPKIDDKLKGYLDRMTKECKFSSAGSSPRDCDALDKEVDAYIREKGISTLDTLTEALHGADDPRKFAAGWLLLANYPSAVVGKVSKKHDELSEGSVQYLLDAVAKNGTRKQGGHSYVELAINLATIKGMNEQATAAIDKIDDEQVKANGVKGLMRYARMANFKKIQEYAASDKKKVKMAALSAPATMFKWTDDEKKDICPWMHGFIQEMNTQTVANAMLTCGGEYVDKFMDEADRRVQANIYKRPFAFATREVCSKTFFGQKKDRTPEQCERNKKFLTDLVDNETVSDDVRGFAASSIAYAWRDEDSLKLMKQYQKHKNAKVKEAADKQVEFLEKWLKTKKK